MKYWGDELQAIVFARRGFWALVESAVHTETATKHGKRYKDMKATQLHDWHKAAAPEGAQARLDALEALLSARYGAHLEIDQKPRYQAPYMGRYALPCFYAWVTLYGNRLPCLIWPQDDRDGVSWWANVRGKNGKEIRLFSVGAWNFESEVSA